MLAAHLYRESRQDAWQDYTAQILHDIGCAAHAAIGAEFGRPSWMEIAQERTMDTRTGGEIRNELVEKLRARRKRRNVQKGGD